MYYKDMHQCSYAMQIRKLLSGNIINKGIELCTVLVLCKRHKDCLNPLVRITDKCHQP